MVLIGKLLREEQGADATEYAFLAALIAIAIITGASTLGQNLGAFFAALGTYIGAMPKP